jgi:ketosteroid isomerase-like protein
MLSSEISTGIPIRFHKLLTREAKTMALATETQATAAEKAVDQYFQAWNARDRNVRVAAVEAACAMDIVYTDPKADVKGHQAFSDMIEAVQTQVATQHPTFAFLRTSAVDEHHGRLRFNWALTGHDAATVLAGVDFAQLSDDGRLQLVVGFFGETPASV